MTSTTSHAASADPSVGFFSQRRTFEELWPAVRSHVVDVLDHGRYSHGRKVGELEEALASRTGADHVVAVNSGTDALVLLLRACGLEPGDEVVVPAFSFIASASAVVLGGGRPVFADIDPVTYGLDPRSVAEVVTERTRMVMPVHLFCQMADMDGIRVVADDHELTIVEDSAEALGMRWDGVHAGLLGAGGILSFFPSKTLGAIGDAGAVLTDDPDVADTVRALRHHGREGRTLDAFERISTATTIPGVNSKMDDLQAAVLLAKLGVTDRDISRRAELADAYTAGLRDVAGVTRLPTIVERDVPTEQVFYVYLVEAERRDELAAHLGASGVETEVYYPRPLHLQPCFSDFGHEHGDFPHAERACERALALPLYPDMDMVDVGRVCELLAGFYEGSAL